MTDVNLTTSVTGWFGSWPSPPPPLRLEGSATVGQWFDTWPGLKSFLRRLVAAGIAESDPDVQLWYAVVTGDTGLAQVALDRGADIEIRDSQIMQRYRDYL